MSQLLSQYGLYIAAGVALLILWKKGLNLNTVLNFFRKNPEEGADDVDLSDGLDASDILALAKRLKELLAQRQEEQKALEELAKEVVKPAEKKS